VNTPIHPDFANRAYDILSIGGLCLEQTVSLPDWPHSGHQQIPVLGLNIKAGGAAPNVAVFASRAGSRVAFIGKVGTDARGRDLLSALEDDGVNTSFCCRVAGKSTTFQIVLTVDDDWSVMLWNDPALDLMSEDIEAKAVRIARFVHLDGYNMFSDQQKEMVERTLSLAQEFGTQVSIDASTRMALEQPEYLYSIMSKADIAFANMTEARHLTRCDQKEDMITAIQAEGFRYFILKAGDRGAYAITENNFFFIPAFQVDVIDTVGAGDGMVAGVLSALVKGKDIREAVQEGAAVGALVCTGAGFLGRDFTRSEIDDILARGKTHDTVEIR
jgi:2-dehydro-3-deoxygluconokinase